MFNITRNGLDAIGKELGVISNNIANSNTNAFKRSRSEFVDFYSKALSPYRNAGEDPICLKNARYTVEVN